MFESVENFGSFRLILMIDVGLCRCEYGGLKINKMFVFGSFS